MGLARHVEGREVLTSEHAEMHMGSLRVFSHSDVWTLGIQCPAIHPGSVLFRSTSFAQSSKHMACGCGCINLTGLKGN